MLKTAVATLLMGMFLSATVATAAPNDNANPNGSDNAADGNAYGPDKKTTAPEIHPVAAGAAGILVIGGLALLTTRRRAHAANT
jgi:hypothetical protein